MTTLGDFQYIGGYQDLCEGYREYIRGVFSTLQGYQKYKEDVLYYLLTNWLSYLYGRIPSPRPNVIPDRREGITRAAGFGFACIDTQAS